MSKQVWVVRLSAAAETDFQNIVEWTQQRFGSVQARIYSQTLTDALILLTKGPKVTGVRDRMDIGEGIHLLHVGRGHRRGRHFVLFRIANDETQGIDVLRILHDAMDLSRHVADESADDRS